MKKVNPEETYEGFDMNEDEEEAFFGLTSEEEELYREEEDDSEGESFLIG